MGQDLPFIKVGQKIECNHPLYHFKRKVWNSTIDQYPQAIFECRSEEDVVEAVRYANKNQLKITVRGGGFHPAGKSVKDQAVLIDLSHMNEIQIDEVSKVATVGAGARLFEIDEITQQYGLAVPLGMISNIGVSGLALGGGLGYLRGKYGLTSDNVLGVHLVTGKGELIYVNPLQHPELFWAIRGAGDNFGVVTKFEMKLYPVGPNVLGIAVEYPFKEIERILIKAEKYRQNAVDEISFSFIISKERMNKPSVRLIGMYDGELNLQVENQVINPLLNLAIPIADNTEILPYSDLQKKYDSLIGNSFAIEGISLFFSKLTNEAMTILWDELEHTNLSVTIYLVELHGKINRVSKYDTAFAFRDANYLLIIDADASEQPEEAKQWIQETYEKLLPYSYNLASYLNSSKVDQKIIQNTYQCILERLIALKKEYDPDNLFNSEHHLTDTK